ncbi:DotU family type IV/VI secretion system protein [Archangium lansingense]|uniref:DotU family type IV/VI secretion system protein n=1 Tax=Archangium lansingense TaxID=2995310 RepID=A0ABT4AEG9_9BACT|nr:DotU family type IV/VI secretion system protein [Archangium lansinium]MCY1080020.1 DotU family type IV/VI secretion system protein [Archangium lansinium]
MRKPDSPSLSSTSSLLLDRARLLFAEILQLRQQVQLHSTATRFNSRFTPGPTVEELRRRLLDRVQEQTRPEGAPRGSLLERHLEECRYVMATFADEVLVHTPWYGQEAWRENLLEDALFGSHDAGDRFFTEVARLLSERDPAREELAAVYMMALALGFQGRYRGLGAEAALQDMQRQLFTLAFQRPPEPDASSRRLVGQAYEHTRDERTDRRPERRGPWVAAIAAALTLTFATSGALSIHHSSQRAGTVPSSSVAAATSVPSEAHR